MGQQKRENGLNLAVDEYYNGIWAWFEKNMREWHSFIWSAIFSITQKSAHCGYYYGEEAKIRRMNSHNAWNAWVILWESVESGTYSRILWLCLTIRWTFTMWIQCVCGIYSRFLLSSIVVMLFCFKRREVYLEASHVHFEEFGIFHCVRHGRWNCQHMDSNVC